MSRESRADGASGRALVRVAGQLTGRDRWLVRMLHEHTVLTTNQLVRVGFGNSERSTQTRLRELARLAVLDRFRPRRRTGSAPWHHVLGPLGARVLAAELGVEVEALGWRHDRALAVAHRLSLGHDVAMTDLVCGLVADPGLRVTAWWSPGRCRRAVGHHRVRPDAYVCLTLPEPRPGRLEQLGRVGEPARRDRVWQMWVEYDNDTSDLARLAAKLHAYHDLAAATGVVVPVAVWIARASREPNARRALADAHRALPDPALVPVLTGSADATGGHAAGAVWFGLRPATAHRVRLAELADYRYGPTLAEMFGRPAQPDGRASERRTGGGQVDLVAPNPYPPAPDRFPPRRRPSVNGATS